MTAAPETLQVPDATRPGLPLVSPNVVMAAVVLFWGLGPPVLKLITAPAAVAVLYRFVLTVPLLYLLTVLRGGRLRLSTLRRTALAGAAFGINMVLVFLAVNAAAVAVVSVMTTLQPVFILFVAGPFLGERPSRAQLVWTVIGTAGAAVVILGGASEVTSSAAGVGYAAGSVATFTLYFLLTKRARSQDVEIDPIEWMTGISVFAALAVAPLALLTASPADYLAVDGADWIWIWFIVLVTGVAGHSLMAWIHRYVEASRSSLYLLLMNVVAVGAAWPLHDEPLTLVQLAGGLVVLVAVGAVISRASGRHRPRYGSSPGRQSGR
jgi:drug/metabolite transporter (DMT)-like permease